jgi:undecaprenyl diphosphate synthase
VLAISYSSRWEITEAVKAIAREVESGTITPDSITSETVSQHLATKNMPDPDLLIRTGGDFRISNFLLWQVAYSEIYVTSTYWPDFTKDDFCKAVIQFQSRERRFGLTSEQLGEQ